MARSTNVLDKSVVRASIAALALLVASGVQAQSYFDPTGMFPSPGYIEQDPLIITYPNGWQVRGLNITVTSGRIAPPGSGFLDTSFNVTHLYDIAPPSMAFSPVSGSGTGMARITFDHMSGATEVFVTELLTLNLSGGPALIRESPSRASFGGFSRTPSGGGWQVDSFFDVFTEISLDGGVTWSPTEGTTRLRGTPEPGTMFVMGVGAALLAVRRWRKAL